MLAADLSSSLLLPIIFLALHQFLCPPLLIRLFPTDKEKHRVAQTKWLLISVPGMSPAASAAGFGTVVVLHEALSCLEQVPEAWGAQGAGDRQHSKAVLPGWTGRLWLQCRSTSVQHLCRCPWEQVSVCPRVLVHLCSALNIISAQIAGHLSCQCMASLSGTSITFPSSQWQ